MSASIALVETKEGILLAVKAQPGSRRNGIVGVHAGAVKVAVTQAAEKRRANLAVLAALANGLGLKESQIELVAGTTSPHKKFLVKGVSMEDLQERLDRVLADN